MRANREHGRSTKETSASTYNQASLSLKNEVIPTNQAGKRTTSFATLLLAIITNHEDSNKHARETLSVTMPALVRTAKAVFVSLLSVHRVSCSILSYTFFLSFVP